MVEGIMKWSSETRQFGFVSPPDGSRDVFVRLSPCERSDVTRGGQPEGRAGTTVTSPTPGREEGAEPFRLATKVEVRTRYQVGHWAPGYEIAAVVESGYHVRRPGSHREMLPEVFVPADVRRE